MKKQLCILCILALLISAAACSPAASGQGSSAPSSETSAASGAGDAAASEPAGTRDAAASESVGTADVAASAAAGDAATSGTAAAYSFADTIAWDGQYDVVVIGFGGAGAVSAKTAADAGAKVLVLEKAPEGEEGGNTRFCGQFFAYGNNNYEGTLAYYKNLAGEHQVPEAMLEVLADNVSRMEDILAEEFGVNAEDFVDWSPMPWPICSMSPEYPEFDTAGTMSLCSAHLGAADAYLWNIFRTNVCDRSENIDVWFDSPGLHLIQDPQTKTIVGVNAERDGQPVNIRALNGVILACGGFENNPEMVQDYLGLAEYAPLGTLYNTGDGIRMAMEVGADLWHMEVFEGNGDFGAAVFETERGQRGPLLSGTSLTSGSVILVGKEGFRYLREDEYTRHGHIYQNGVWQNAQHPGSSFLIFDQAELDEICENGFLEPSDPRLMQADTIEALAETAGITAENLADTLASYNEYARNGYDPEFKRTPESMSEIKAPFYAIRMIPDVLNTQGGPRRNENAEVLDTNGVPIPHLYSAGELGGMTAYHYQGGTNIAECITFGRIAGKNAAAEKEALPAYTALTPVASELLYLPGVESDLVKDTTSVELAENEYIGVGSGGMGGDITLKVTIVEGVIEAIEIVEENGTPEKFEPVKDQLISAIIEKNSTDVDTVSGSTMSSKAVIAAVGDAVEQSQN